MKNPLGVSPSKGNQGTTRGKEKNYFDLGGNRTHDLRIRSTVILPTEHSTFIIDPNPNNSYKTKKMFTGSYAEVNRIFVPLVYDPQLIKKVKKNYVSCVALVTTINKSDEC